MSWQVILCTFACFPENIRGASQQADDGYSHVINIKRHFLVTAILSCFHTTLIADVCNLNKAEVLCLQLKGFSPLFDTSVEIHQAKEPS